MSDVAGGVRAEDVFVPFNTLVLIAMMGGEPTGASCALGYEDVDAFILAQSGLGVRRFDLMDVGGFYDACRLRGLDSVELVEVN